MIKISKGTLPSTSGGGIVSSNESKKTARLRLARAVPRPLTRIEVYSTDASA